MNKKYSGIILMEHDGYYHLGTIVRTHGVKGNLVILLDVDDPLKYKKINAVFVENNQALTKYEVTNSSLLGDLLNVHLGGVEDMTTAETFIKCHVFLPLTSLPPLAGNKLYLHEAVGMMVVDAALGEIGRIEKIFDLPEQPVASIIHKGKEVLFPLLSVFIDTVDRDNKILNVKLPEGLLDVYLA